MKCNKIEQRVAYISLLCGVFSEKTVAMEFNHLS